MIIAPLSPACLGSTFVMHWYSQGSGKSWLLLLQLDLLPLVTPLTN
jgi:hypothetical protein